MPFLFLYTLLYPLLLVVAKILALFHPKIRKGFKLRKNKPWLQGPANSQPIWFHCASGEFEYAKPVIRELKKNHPQLKILVTYFSPSIEKNISQFPGVDFYSPTPWDFYWSWNQFIHHHKPQALLIARTDLWPMMILATVKNKIPRLLFSKTVNKHQSGLTSVFSGYLMKKMDDIFCVSEEDRKLLSKKLKPYNKIHAAGDTRYDQCLFRLQHGKSLKPLNNFNKPTMVCGSTWPSDEVVLFELIHEQIKNIAFIVAPHEPTTEHLKDLTSSFSKMGVKYQLYSQTQSWDPDAVLIVDEVGILADLYKWGQFAFIGGSMNRSVHSVMEPLAQGLLCFVGPNHFNNREALTFQQLKIQDMTPVQVIHNSDELVRRFVSLHRSWSQSHQLDLQLAVRNKAGASKIVLRWLENHLS